MHLPNRQPEELAWSDLLILALPRGGVPVAFEIAKAFYAPLDVLLVRKIGAPSHSEYGIDGANPRLVLSEQAMAIVRPDSDYIEAEKRRQLPRSSAGEIFISGTGDPSPSLAERSSCSTTVSPLEGLSR
jgi:predicted phosphoribosyltransferase